MPGKLQSMESQRVGHDWAEYCTLCIYHILLIHSSVMGIWEAFHVLVIMNNAPVYIGVQMSKTLLSNVGDVYLEVNYGNSFIFFLNETKMNIFNDRRYISQRR